MTVKQLLCDIIENSQSMDQKVILFSEVEVFGDSFKSAAQHNQINVSINGDCLQLFMMY